MALEVHLGQLGAAVIDGPARNDRQPGEQRFGLGPLVGLDDTDDEIRSVAEFLLRAAEHGERLADARAHAEKDFELSSARLNLGAFQRSEQGVGIGTAVRHGLHLPWDGWKAWASPWVNRQGDGANHRAIDLLRRGGSFADGYVC